MPGDLDLVAKYLGYAPSKAQLEKEEKQNSHGQQHQVEDSVSQNVQNGDDRRFPGCDSC